MLIVNKVLDKCWKVIIVLTTVAFAEVSTRETNRRILNMMVLADISLSAVIWWLIVGLIAGFLASIVMRGGGYGIVGDIIVGLIGAFIGGWLFSLLGIGAGGLIGSIVVAFIGACILIFLLRLISGSYGRGRTL
jgi:uncharacterized membrane protein YeaQ/YmgE (transglycosylase-associated protein family)